MDKFEFKIDVDTPYIKTIRFLGAVLLGYFLGAIVVTLQLDSTVNWISSATGILIGLWFAFFPRAAKQQSLTIDQKGIYLHNYTFHFGEKKEITWEKVKGIGVHKNVIEIRNSIGSMEKIKLPLHTKSQVQELESYLKQVTKIKELDYIKSTMVNVRGH